MTLQGHTVIQSKAVWLEFVIFLAAAAALVPNFFLLGLVWARLISTFVNLAFMLYSVRQHCGISLRSVSFALLRPLVGAILMNLLVQYVTSVVNGELQKLVIGAITGAIFFTIWSMTSWWVVGKPTGLESTVLDYLKPKSVTS
jgi:hypothetical protein